LYVDTPVSRYTHFPPENQNLAVLPLSFNPAFEEMHIQPRHEIHDFRDLEVRNARSSGWNLDKVMNVVALASFIGFTVSNVYIIAKWLRNWMSRGNAPRRAKRSHAREWDIPVDE